MDLPFMEHKDLGPSVRFGSEAVMVNVRFRPEANIRWLTSAFTSARPVSHAGHSARARVRVRRAVTRLHARFGKGITNAFAI
jgi:hypothetical protein